MSNSTPHPDHGERRSPSASTGNTHRTVRRLGLALVATLGVVFAGCAILTSTAQAAAVTVPTVSCPTSYGSTGPHPAIPKRVSVRGNPASVRGLVAYADPYAHILGPAGMQCSAESGADGSQNIMVWPKGQREPRAHANEQGLNLQVIPACAGCMYSLVCPVNPQLANQIFPGGGISCVAAPAQEEILRQGNLSLFTDPPAVAGDGFPSGGQYSSYGAVGWTRSRGAFGASCALPADEKSVCTVSLNDAIGVLY